MSSADYKTWGEMKEAETPNDANKTWWQQVNENRDREYKKRLEEAEKRVAGADHSETVQEKRLDVERLRELAEEGKLMDGADYTDYWEDCPNEEPGKKFDGDKVRMDLLSPSALMEVAKVLTFGANKYGDRNWEKGINYSRVYGAVQRHLNQYWGGEKLDRETGINHLAHAACGLLFLLHYESDQEKYGGFNDNPSYSEQ